MISFPISEMMDAAEKLCGFSQDDLAVLKQTLDNIAASPALLDAFSQIRQKCVIDLEFDDRPVCADENGLQLAAALSAVRSSEARLAAEGQIPMACFYEALQDVRVWMHDHINNFGFPGLEYGNGFAWIALRVLTGEVLRFGRLEYNKSLAFPDLLIFKHKRTGERQMILNGVYPFDANGRITVPENAAFRSHTPYGIFNSYFGNTVDRDGRVSSTCTEFDLRNDWECELRPGDETVYIHIPSGCPLSGFEESLKAMKKYYFNLPDFHPKAVICGSWLFSPVLPEILPPDSNLCRFQKIGWLIPSTSPDSDALRRVFGVKAELQGVHAVPWKSSLQQKIGERIARGEKIPGGRIVLFPDEIPD